jgi:hypothetical protein
MRACCEHYSLAGKGTAWPPGEKNLPQVAKVVCQMMVNRSDRHFPNLRTVKAVTGRWSNMEKMRGFPSWPGALLPMRGRIHERKRITRSRQSALRMGLGPYMTLGHILPLRMLTTVSKEIVSAGKSHITTPGTPGAIRVTMRRSEGSSNCASNVNADGCQRLMISIRPRTRRSR